MFLGREQLDWLKAGLKNSRAVWKVIAADMPLGLNVGDGSTAEGLPRWDAVANGEEMPARSARTPSTGRSDRNSCSSRRRRQVNRTCRRTAACSSFGEVNIQAHSADLTVDLRDINGMSVFGKTLQPRLY